LQKSGTGKHERGEAFKTLKDELIASLGEEADEVKQNQSKIF
jgi:polyribonucleotide nucleotidyltransferase